MYPLLRHVDTTLAKGEGRMGIFAIYGRMEWPFWTVSASFIKYLRAKIAPKWGTDASVSPLPLIYVSASSLAHLQYPQAL